MTEFNYDEAFSRNIGLLSTDEQGRLSSKTVGIAGCGGMGGAHAFMLARLGVGNFKLADPDVYELVNFNRQFGATMDTIGQRKVLITAKQIASINPEASTVSFLDGVTPENVERFVTGCDLIMDGIDFFELDVRRMLFAEAYKQGAPVITAAPVGFHGAVLTVDPAETDSLEELCRFSGSDTKVQALQKFITVVAPGIDWSQFDMKSIDFGNNKAPSTIIGVMSAAATAGLIAKHALLTR